MQSSTGPCSSDSSTVSLERFRRRQRRRLLSSNESAPSAFFSIPGPDPVDLYLRNSPLRPGTRGRASTSVVSSLGSSRTSEKSSSSEGGSSSGSSSSPGSSRTSRSSRSSESGRTSRSRDTYESNATFPLIHGNAARAATPLFSHLQKANVVIGSSIAVATPIRLPVDTGSVAGPAISPPLEKRGLLEPSISRLAAFRPSIFAPSPRAAGSFQAAQPSRAAGPLTNRPKSAYRKVNLGIETEVYLTAYNSKHASQKMKEFVKLLAADYNAQPDIQHRIHGNLQVPGTPDSYQKWSVVFKATNATSKSPCEPFIS